MNNVILSPHIEQRILFVNYELIGIFSFAANVFTIPTTDDILKQFKQTKMIMVCMYK